MWFSCMRKAIVASPCRGPDGAIYCWSSGYMDWRCNQSLGGCMRPWAKPDPALLRWRLQWGSRVGLQRLPVMQWLSSDRPWTANTPSNSDHVRANGNRWKRSAGDCIFLSQWFWPPALMQPHWAATPGVGSQPWSPSPWLLAAPPCARCPADWVLPGPQHGRAQAGPGCFLQHTCTRAPLRAAPAAAGESGAGPWSSDPVGCSRAGSLAQVGGFCTKWPN